MQTLNILDTHLSDFNPLRAFDTSNFEKTNLGLGLLEQLQTSLDIESILNMFAMEASKFVDLSGMYFKKDKIKKSIRGNRKGKYEQIFELSIAGEFIGILTYVVNSPISLASYKILNGLHKYLVYPLKNASQYYQAMKLAMQDPLTGLGNRRYFDEQLSRAMYHGKRHSSEVGLIVCDLDKFKVINDNFGHNIGDKVLFHFANALRSSVRHSDSVFRFGGDEFSIIVESACKQSLIVIENRINDALSQDTLLAKYQVLTSLGMTFMNSTDSDKSFFKRADQLLYKNKQCVGRNISIV